ncbi:MAG: toll/interleukin-1 receptor domain-containing protein [Pseudomonadota bacterium]
MAYDVFLVYANEDKDTAALVARRLRALKFKVRFNKAGEKPTFDDKDARDALKSQSMLILWSKDAVQSDWVRAAASVGHSRSGMLVEAALDKTVPYEPFRNHKRFDISGFTPRNAVEGWYLTVEELGRRDGRKDLRAWIDIPNKDEDAKTAWLSEHPTDPLALHADALREKKRATKPAPAPAAAGAAALTASAIGQGPATAAPAPATARPVAAAATTPRKPEQPPALEADQTNDIEWLIPAVLAGIAALFYLSYLNRSQPLPRGPAIANAEFGINVCPAGTVPSNLLPAPILEPGPIINDTE